ncbi:ABC-2 transporter permease, partial [Amphibacillus sediminis]|uniref:ABC-2 transporter permease n=1 Tax=Amphibacillus sediminis TaxID=360185 RepID=UPI0008361093
MTTIKNLIKLDFYAMKPLAKTMVAFLIIPIILGLVADQGMSIMVTLTFMVFMLNSVFSITEQSNFNKLYGVLPIKKSLNIISRYLFSLLVLICTAALSFLIFMALSIISNGSINWTNGIIYLTVSIVIALFFISIQYPIYFKFEFSKANLMAILPYIVFFAIGAPLIQYLMKNVTFYTNVMKVINYFYQ